MKVVYLLVALILFTFIVFLACEPVYFKHPVPKYGEVVEMVFAPSSVGVGSTVNSKGDPSVIYDSEKWVVVVQDGNDFVTTTTTPKIFSNLRRGQGVTYNDWVGNFSGRVYSKEIN